jgi:hypothetical protein
MFDGKPLEGVIVILHPLEDVELGDAKPRARTDADGSFKVYTFMTDDGAPAGAYDVSILPKKPKQEGGTARSKGAKRQAKANERAAEAAAGKPTTKKAKSDKTPNPAKHQEKKMEIEALVPVRYRNKETSGLRIQVKEGINNLEPFLLEK